MHEQTFDLRLDKLTEAVVYLVKGSENDPGFSETKLVKLLYYADCAAYLQIGAPITGVTYLRYPHGPYPQDWASHKDTMTEDGDVAVLPAELVGDARRHRWIAKRPSAEGILSAPEKAILSAQLLRFAGFNAAELEDYSHQEFGWILTEPGEAIPYDLAGLSNPPLTEALLDSARRIAANVANG